ncbi:MAG: FtsL-like putative cell division protein [Bacteroidota bacterium]|nr:FtsL-like putative cell division protein [Bacteroidota bacterium]
MNRIKSEENPEPEIQKKNKHNRFSEILRIPIGLLTGRTFKDLDSNKLIKITVYISLLVVLLISNTYYGQKNAREIGSLTKELKKLKFEHIATKAELTNITKQSSISKSLKQRGIKESTVPPQKIIINK